MLTQILWFLPWCWLVNMSYDLLLPAGRIIPWIKTHNTPVDRRFVMPDGYRLLGDSTTGLGLILASTLGLCGALAAPGHYFFLFAVLTWCGHALGSFVKRRLGMERGAYLMGVDHIDYVVVAGVAALLLGQLSFSALLLSVLVTFIVTPVVTRMGYRLSMRIRPI